MVTLKLPSVFLYRQFPKSKYAAGQIQRNQDLSQKARNSCMADFKIH